MVSRSRINTSVLSSAGVEATPRIVLGLEILAQIVHPDLFHNLIPAATARLYMRAGGACHALSALSSGVGKTTVAAAIMGALTVRGYKVQPFVEAVASRTERFSQ